MIPTKITEGDRPMRKLLKTTVSALTALALAVALAAPCWADSTETTSAAADVDMTIFDPAALEQMTADFISEWSSHNVRAERISFAYTYLATGETWFYNPDTWYYSASMYKVPLMMILAQQEYNGELTQETDIKGITLAKAEESILVYSNNDYAHLMLNYLGTDQEAREMYKQFSSLPDDYYDPDFIDYSYFTVRFMNDVMTTLYNNQERFPNIIDCLKRAQPVDYFHLCTDPELVIAQKYGSYNEWNGTTGIIYTPNPVILTVMMKNVEGAEEVIANAAKMFVDYTLTLDGKLTEYTAEKAEAVRAAEEKAAQEEAARAEEARLAQEEADRKAAEDAARAEEARIAQENAQRAAARRAFLTKTVVAVVIVAVLAVSGVVSIKKINAAKTASRGGRGGRGDRGGGGYTPRH